MGDVGSARYEPPLLPPCPTIRVLSYSNCQKITQVLRDVHSIFDSWAHWAQNVTTLQQIVLMLSDLLNTDLIK